MFFKDRSTEKESSTESEIISHASIYSPFCVHSHINTCTRKLTHTSNTEQQANPPRAGRDKPPSKQEANNNSSR